MSCAVVAHAKNAGLRCGDWHVCRRTWSSCASSAVTTLRPSGERLGARAAAAIPGVSAPPPPPAAAASAKGLPTGRNSCGVAPAGDSVSGKSTLVMGAPASPLLEPLASLESLHAGWTLVHWLPSSCGPLALCPVHVVFV